jgi:hypothetical protein
MSTAAAAGSADTGIIVRPLSGRGETVVFVIAVALLIGCTVGYTLLHPRNDNVQKLLSYQISSFDGLNHVDQSIHSALLPAVDEILWHNNTTGGWSLIADLEKSGTPPFYKDVFWRVNGQMHWQAVLPGAIDTNKLAPTAESVHQEPGAPPPPPNAVYKGTLGQGAASYYGSGGRLPGQSAFLVVIGHAHSGVYWINQATIWVHRDPQAPFPKLTKTEVLIQEGWRQVVPYSGAVEFERLRGTKG